MEESLFEIKDECHIPSKERRVYISGLMILNETLTIDEVYEKYGDSLTEKQIQFLENERTK